MENTLNGKGLAIQKLKKDSASLLNTDNKHDFVFEYEDILINVQGGLNDEKLDSLRVTLKITKVGNHVPVRHNINLFHHTQVEKFIRTLSYRLEMSDVPIRRAFIALTNELEQYRLDSQSGESDEAIINYELPDEERKEAEALLASDDLLTQTNNLIGLSGMIGEEINRMLMYLIITSRRTSNPLHAVVHGSSAAGKTHLLNKVSEYVPSEDKVEFTQLSANAFYYYRQNDLKNKLILIEDMDGADEGLLPLRELQTKKRISKSIVHKGIGGIGKTKNLIVEGPVSVIGCTTKEAIYEDNSNRSFLLYVDEGPEQDKRIMNYQRLKYAGKIDEFHQQQSAKKLRNVQRLLKPIRIVNPFAEYLELPQSVFKPRRTNLHYLQLIEVITFYHQYQRERLYDEETGEEYIETTLKDIIEANKLIKDVLLRKSDPLNGVTRDFYKSLTSYLDRLNSKTYFNHEIRKELRVKESTLRRYHKLLLAEGYIQKRPDLKGLSDCYEVLNVDEFKETEKAIEKALQLCIDTASSSQVRHTQNDEVKSLNNSSLIQSRHKS